MKFNINKIKEINKRNLILIEGLPGMGNVGKIAVDFIVDELKAEKILEISSSAFPNCVFVKEDHTISLPLIELHQKKFKDKTLLFMTGDIQPINEDGSYEFCNLILDIFEKNKGKEIITLGGIGLQNIPKKPKLYITGNNKNIIKKYANSELNTNIYGVVDPIIGVTGLLLGVAGERKIPAIAILSETFAHPAHLELRGARELLKYLNKKFKLKLNLNALTKETEEIEKEIEKTNRLNIVMKKKAKKGLDYIG